MHENLIILAGGASSRMKQSLASDTLSAEEQQQANQRSKGLIGIGPDNRPLLDFLLYNAKQAGYKKIYFIVGKDNVLFRQLYGLNDKNNQFRGLSICYAIQHIPEDREKPLGTADALLQCLEQYPELQSQAFSVCNSDNLYSVRALTAVRIAEAPNAFISYDRDHLDFPLEKIYRFALAKLDPENHLIDIVEKPAPELTGQFKDTQGKLRVSMNLFKFTGSYIFHYVRNCPMNEERKEKELQTAILNMLRKFPKSMVGIPMAEHVPDLTSKEDIAIMKDYILKHYTSLKW